MKHFNLQPSRVVGEIKEAIKEAILDGKIENRYDEAFDLMLQIAPKYGLESKK